MRFGNLRTTVLAIGSAALLAPALAAQTDSKQLNTAATTSSSVIAVRAMSQGPGAVNLEWDGVRGAVSYRIERRMLNAEDLEQRDPRRIAAPFFGIANGHKTNAYTDTGLYPDATFEYRVTAQFDTKSALQPTTVIPSGTVRVTTAP